MQYEGTFKEFFDLLTETYERHKRKPQDLEKALRKVINTGKEMLQQQRSDIAENKNEKCKTPAFDKRYVLYL